PTAPFRLPSPLTKPKQLAPYAAQPVNFAACNETKLKNLPYPTAGCVPAKAVALRTGWKEIGLFRSAAVPPM
ncbi:MAG TPA: hypothetical protein VGB87_06280, partial [Vicinamibacteria bacterium]